jgi:DMSO reductase anchor subunit
MITDEELGKELLRLKIIWFGMLGSLIIYLIIGLQIATNIQTSMDKSTFGVLKTVLYLFTFTIIAITRYIRRFILSGKGQNVLATQNFQPLTLQKYTTAMIVAWALLECIGIFGLILYLLGKNPMDLYILILISAAAMLWYRPKKDELIGLAQKS